MRFRIFCGWLRVLRFLGYGKRARQLAMRRVVVTFQADTSRFEEAMRNLRRATLRTLLAADLYQDSVSWGDWRWRG